MNEIELAELTEAKISEEIGCSLSVLKEFRQTLLPGIDFDRIGNRIKWNSEGMKKLLVHLGLRNADEEEPIVTIKSLCLNSKLLIGELSDGREVKVAVRSNINFMKGMKLKVKKDGEIYEFQGRLPRSRGRW